MIAALLPGLLACTTPPTPPAASASAPVAQAPAPVDAAPAPQRFDARLSLYDYPFPVSMFAVDAQRQSLEMAYMDVAPAEPNGAAVLLLHGKNFSGAYWERTATALADEGYRVIIPDQLGFGKSSKPESFQYTFEALAYHTAALLDSLEVSEVHVVGHSMGGMVAVRFALMYPERVPKLALVNPIGLEDWQQFVPYVPVSHWYKNELGKTPEGVRAYMQESYFDGQWDPAYDALAELQAGWSESADRELLAWSSALTYDMILTQPVVYELGRLAMPTQLILGDRDRTALGKPLAPPELREEMGRYDRLGEVTRDAIPDAALVTLEGVGHLPQFEAYEDYWSALSGFLQ